MSAENKKEAGSAVSESRDYPEPSFGPQYDDNVCPTITICDRDSNAPEVQTIRDFRENILRKSTAGRMVISVYDFLREPLSCAV